MREVIINTRSQNRQLARDNETLRRQNFRLRAVLLHHCETCRPAEECAERQRLVKAALDG